MEIVCTSIDNLKEMEFNEYDPVIVLLSPREDKIKLPKYCKVVQLTVSNIEQPTPDRALYRVEQAQQIINMLRDLEYIPNKIVVACKEGIVRSSAVAAALDKYFNNVNEARYMRDLPNGHILRVTQAILQDSDVLSAFRKKKSLKKMC